MWLPQVNLVEQLDQWKYIHKLDLNLSFKYVNYIQFKNLLAKILHIKALKC